jgi:ADP-ribose pyrophosphatase
LRAGVLAEDPYIGYVIRDAVRFSDGRLGLYNRVVASGGVVVLPILGDAIALIRIFRHASRRWSFEAPQGFVPAGHDPAEEARREVIEEMGATVGELTSLGVVYTSTGLTSENLKMFAAQITAVGDPQRSEGIESIGIVPKGDIDRLVLDGTICDGPTMSLILRARMRGLL